MSDGQAQFEGWARVELMGHQSETGFVQTEYFGSAAFLRISRPALPECRRLVPVGKRVWTGERYATAGEELIFAAVEPFTRLVSSAAIYAINPLSEAEGLLEMEGGRSVRAAADEAVKRLAPLVAASDEDDYGSAGEEGRL